MKIFSFYLKFTDFSKKFIQNQVFITNSNVQHKIFSNFPFLKRLYKYLMFASNLLILQQQFYQI